MRSCGQRGGLDTLCNWMASSRLGCSGGDEVVMGEGQVMTLFQDEMTKERSVNILSCWLGFNQWVEAVTNKLYLIRTRVPPPFGWTLFAGGWWVWRRTMLVNLVSPLVEGWPLPGSWPVVYHSAWKAPSAFWRGPSLWVRLDLPVVVIHVRTSMLSDKRVSGSQEVKW